MEIVRNRYLSKLISKMNNGLVKIITGIRRCGKSYLLNQIFYRYLIKTSINKDHIIMISLDDLENEHLLDPYKLNEYVKSKIIDNGKYYVFIDEIQEVSNFVKVFHYFFYHFHLHPHILLKKFQDLHLMRQRKDQSHQKLL